MSDLLALFKLGRLKTCYLFISFCLLLIAAAFEGFSLGLLVPFLKQAAGMGNYDGWKTIPLMGTLLKQLQFEKLLHRIDLILILLVLVVFIRQVATYMSQVLYGFVTYSLEERLRVLGYQKLLSYGCSFFDAQKKGEIHNVLMRFTQQVAYLLSALFSIWYSIFFACVYIVVLWKVSPQLCLISFVLGPFFYLFTHNLLHVIQRLYRQILKNEQSGHGLSLDIFSNIKLVKALGREEIEAKTFARFERSRAKDSILAHNIQGVISPLQEVLMTAGLALIIWISFNYYFKNDPTFLIKMIVSLLLFRRALQSFNGLISSAPEILKHYPYVGALNRLLDESDKHVVRYGTKRLAAIKQGIEYRNVSMGYGDSVTLKNISCFISAGSFTAIVGASGAGKTTLVELLLRFYEYQAGDILVDGISVRDYDIVSLRRSIGFVSQETLVLNDTLYNNIIFSRPEATRAEVLTAARKAHVLEFVENLEKGLDTIIGDRGIKLSGGELQRLSIARVMLQKPFTLVLDEATSALDSISEQYIQKSLTELSSGCTTLAIAHRLSTIKNAEKIIVLEQGSIQEMGGYLELLSKQGGFFRRYWEAQSGQIQPDA